MTVALGGKAVVSAEAPANGTFAVTVHTPKASLNAYTITVEDGVSEPVTIEDILFGELWLASGQSNMEYPNRLMTGTEEMFASIAGLPIRYYLTDPPANSYSTLFPRHPSDENGGAWGNADSHDLLLKSSAVCTAFQKELVRYFDEQIPVGVLQAHWGSVSIHTLLPEEAIYSDSELLPLFQKANILTPEEKWNQNDGGNAAQHSILYNLKVAPLRGLRVRGLLWYQGENEVSREYNDHYYKQALRCLYRTYKNEFAADPDHFVMISSLIYPWCHSAWKGIGEGETHVGVLNRTYVDLSLEMLDTFAIAPNADLQPSWAFHKGNTPLHPTHKYEVGDRLARLAETNCYGANGQKTAAVLISAEREGDRIIAHFTNTADGLWIRGRKARGLYIAGENDLYIAAYAEVIAPDTLAVYHPYLKNPKNIAYNYASFEDGVNLFAGNLPVAPFATQTDKPITIQAKPWLNMEKQSLWAYCPRERILNMFSHPVWQPGEATEICYDPVISRSGCSLHIMPEGAKFSAFVKSYFYNRLDLQNYKGLSVCILNTSGLTAQIDLTIGKSGEQFSLPLKQTEELNDGWYRYEADFAEIPDGEIAKMAFSFTQGEGAVHHFVNLDDFILIPKN